jgi:hypothetical protein
MRQGPVGPDAADKRVRSSMKRCTVKEAIDDIAGDAGRVDLGGNRRPASIVTIIPRVVLIGLNKGK